MTNEEVSDWLYRIRSKAEVFMSEAQNAKAKEAAATAIKALEKQKNDRWIPVSERLPEEFQRVLVTIVNYKGDKVVRVAEYYNRKGIGEFRIKENNEMWEVGEEGLLAWMPLPEPYKEDCE